MWVFGYGSLMIDGWEDGYGCTQRVVAELRGYQRVFDKASIVNWGTRACPCPTLNLRPCSKLDGCVGTAFEFPDERRVDVEAYLVKREGKGFELKSLEVTATGAGVVQALVPIYTGKNVLIATSRDDLLKLIQQASGKSGNCTTYVLNVYDELAKAGIQDAAVTSLRNFLVKFAREHGQ
ncbi:ChaC-like protein [Caballeronia sordidicola]|uniref:glutathione-specific gamma-glutamylcyclotransferase n=1 Tax=Caballeronia sordidicola TaxID=196367 RepID=A0A158EPT1_CABSO|nr:gamma-glutamylcyclotransferase [Caballeronia sordidicola]SAL09547.1 ChaC-like protein [Caballeronia sordidicola]